MTTTSERNLALAFEAFVRAKPADEFFPHGSMGWTDCGCALDQFVSANETVWHEDVKHDLCTHGFEWVWEILNHRGSVSDALIGDLLSLPDGYPDWVDSYTVNSFGQLAECFDFTDPVEYVKHLIAREES